MGNYSAFLDQDINILDEKGLMECKRFDEEDYSDVIIINEDKDEVEINFGEWDGRKIEGYWYPEFKTFLKEIAKYIEGYAEFQYEEGYNFRIIFKDKTPYFLKQKTAWEGDMQNLNTDELEEYHEKN